MTGKHSSSYWEYDGEGVPYHVDPPNRISFSRGPSGPDTVYTRSGPNEDWVLVPNNQEALMPQPYMSPGEINTARERFLRDIAVLARSVAVSRRFPAQPPEGSILKFERTFGHPGTRVYTYVAFRAPNGDWYLTGEESTSTSWDTLQATIGNSKCEIATGFAEIPLAEVPDIEKVTDPAKWFEMAFPTNGPPAVEGQQD